MPLLGKLARILNNKGVAGALEQGAEQPVFYSALEDAIRTSPTAKAPAAQWQATLSKAPNVKPQELEWSGFNKLGKDNNPVDTWTREDLLTRMEEAKKAYEVDETFMSKDDIVELMSPEAWQAKYGDKIEAERKHQIKSKFGGVYSTPYVDVVPVNRPVALPREQLEKYVKDYDKSAAEYRMRADRHRHGGTLFEPRYASRNDARYAEGEAGYYEEIGADYKKRLDELNKFETLDDKTLDLFTGKPMQSGFRVKLTGGRDATGKAIEEFIGKRLYKTEDKAYEAGAKLVEARKNRAEKKFMESEGAKPEYLERAIRVIERRSPRVTGRKGGVEYRSYALPGGKDYDELLLTLPGQSGKYTAGHFSKYRDEGKSARGPILAHVRFSTRTAPGEPKPELKQAYEQAEAAHKQQQQKIYDIQNAVGDGGWLSVPMEERTAMINERQRLQAVAALAKQEMERSRGPSKKVLAIDEIQSDWHQAARKIGGYRETDQNLIEQLRKAAQETQPTTEAELMEIFNQLKNLPAYKKALAIRVKSATANNDFAREFERWLNGQQPGNWNTDTLNYYARQESATAATEADRILRGLLANASESEKAEIQQALALIKQHAGPIIERKMAADKAHKAFMGATQGPAKAPFSNNVWATVALKRIARYAADNGYDELAWSGKIKNGNWAGQQNNQADASQKGGEFYDNVLVNEANKLFKPAKAQVGKSQVPIDSGGTLGEWNSLQLTPEVIELIKKGFPLFAIPAAAGLTAGAGGFLSRLNGRRNES